MTNRDRFRALAFMNRYLRRLKPKSKISLDVFTTAGHRAVTITAPWAK